MKANRKEKFETYFKEYYPRLCSIAYGYIPDTESCEDVVQEAFIAMWEKGKDSLPENEFYAYLVRSVRNGCISYLRKNKKELILSIEDHKSGMEPQTEHPETEQQAHPEDLLNEIMKILPERCREIFLMSKLHAMKYREIAQKLNLSEKTVENQMGKAIKLLRQYTAGRPLPFLLTFLLFELFIHLWQ